MKLIGIDSSGMTASVAILEDDLMVAEYSVNYKKTHSQTLLPMLDEIVKMTETDINTVDAIAIAKGPGSFTGLRIGSATAKGLGLALDIPIVEVLTTDALAYNLYGTDRVICPLMDARRDQVYTGLYEFEKNADIYTLRTLLPATALSIEEILEKVNKTGRNTVFLGDGVPVFIDKIKELTKVDHIFAPAGKNRQSAGSVAALGAEKYKAGEYISSDDHVPEYLRLSQAERELKEKESR